MDIQSNIILISGPTASGKSKFAIKLAKKLNGEIINADSMQVYKQLNILTSRPSKKFEKKIKHHLFGFVNVSRTFSTGEWLKLSKKKIKEIIGKKKIPIIVGGTGLYFKSLVEGMAVIPNIPMKIRNNIRELQKKEGQKKFYKRLLKLDPSVKNKFDKNDVQRSIRAYEVIKFTRKSLYQWIDKTKKQSNQNNFIKIYIDYPRKDLLLRIFKRADEMIKKGAIEEVNNFRKLNISNDKSASKIIGIKELGMYLDKKITLDEARELLVIRTRQYAKRQITWFRGKMTDWSKINPKNLKAVLKKINKSSLNLDQLT